MGDLDVSDEAVGCRQRSMFWVDGAVLVVDQSALPQAYRWLRLGTVEEVIAGLAVRGVPAIGVAGAFGVALSARRHAGAVGGREAVHADSERLIAARPAAANLAWGVRRALTCSTMGPTPYRPRHRTCSTRTSA
jgi:methylthioribose-1-phosphate isomerase